MPTYTHLVANTAADGADLTTTSFSVDADDLAFVTVAGRQAVSANFNFTFGSTTLTGMGAWSRIQNQDTVGGSKFSLAVFYARASAASTGTVTVLNDASPGATVQKFSVGKWTSASDTLGTPGMGQTASTSPSVSIAAPAATSGGWAACHSAGDTDGITVGAGFTEASDTRAGSTLQVQYDNAAPASSSTWSGCNNGTNITIYVEVPEQTFAASSACSRAAATSAASTELIFEATSACSRTAATSAATALQTFAASSACSRAAATSAATAEAQTTITATSACSRAAATSAATAVQTYAAVAACTRAPATSAATALQTFAATSACSRAAATSAAVTALAFAATSACSRAAARSTATALGPGEVSPATWHYAYPRFGLSSGSGIGN